MPFRPGKIIWVKGQGHESSGNYGDLLINFNYKNVPNYIYSFKFEENDTKADVWIDPVVAMAGGKLNVQTLAGIKELIIPAGT